MGRHYQERASSSDDLENEALRDITARVSTEIGEEFFHAIVRQLAKALEADSVALGEFLEGPAPRVRSLAAVTNGRRDRFDCELTGSAASLVLTAKPCFARSGASRHFPEDPVLARLHAEAFVGTPLVDEDCKPVGILIAFYRHPVADLSGARSLLKILARRASAELLRKRKEDRLRESEQRYRVFIMRNPIAMWRIDFREPIPVELPEERQIELIHEQGYLAECNDSFVQLMGAEDAASLKGKAVEELLPAAQHGPREATFRLIRSGYGFTTSEVDLVNRSGDLRHHIRTAWGIVENDRLLRIWGTTQDVTDLRRSQTALEAAERRIARMLEVVQVAVLVIDLDGTIRYANQFLKSVTGKDEGELAGRNWIDALMPEEERERVRSSAEEAHVRDQAHLESAMATRSGKSCWIAWDSASLRDSRGEVEAIVLMGRDITEQRAAEEQFRQVQKLEGIGRLAGGIAHDFNNLLTVITGYCALLLDRRELPEPAHSAVEQVQKAADKGAQLTRQLLTFSRRQDFRPRVLKLNAIIADAESLLRPLIGEEVRLVSSLDPAAGCVRADPGHIHQVLMNLVLNARDAMPDGGSITIRSENRIIDRTPASSAAGVPAGDYVVLSVTDTGVGMTEEVRSHMFEPFFTTKERGKGTGMGLSMVYGIVRQTGGHIAVDSEPGRGTRFQIFLPRIEGQDTSCQPASGETLRGGSETILIVEDHNDVRAVAARTLRGLGYSVFEAGSPLEAVALVDQGPDIHLLLTDMKMPGMNGSSLAQLLLERKPGMRVLLMSGHTEVPEVAERLSQSEFAFLQKPFTPTALAAKVREALDAKL